MEKVLYIGLDVHKETITIATAEEGRKAAKEFKTVPSDYTRLLKAVRLLTPRGGYLTEIDVPDEADEALRDLDRSPDDHLEFHLPANILQSSYFPPPRTQRATNGIFVCRVNHRKALSGTASSHLHKPVWSQQ